MLSRGDRGSVVKGCPVVGNGRTCVCTWRVIFTGSIIIRYCFDNVIRSFER